MTPHAVRCVAMTDDCCTLAAPRPARRAGRQARRSAVGRCRSSTPAAACSPSTPPCARRSACSTSSHLGKARSRARARRLRQRQPDQRPGRIGPGPGAVHAVLHTERRRRRRPHRLLVSRRRGVPGAQRGEHRGGGRRCWPRPRPAGVDGHRPAREFAVLAVQGPRVGRGAGRARAADRAGLHGVRWTPASTARRCGCAAPATPASTATSCCRPGTTRAAVWDALLARGAVAGAAGRPRRPGHPAHRDGLPAARAGPSAEITPVQARCGWAVGWSKPEFWGRDALVRRRRPGPARTLWGLRALDRGVLRPGQTVLRDGAPVGETTSGTFSPTLKVGHRAGPAGPDAELARGGRGGGGRPRSRAALRDRQPAVRPAAHPLSRGLCSPYAAKVAYGASLGSAHDCVLEFIARRPPLARLRGRARRGVGEPRIREVLHRSHGHHRLHRGPGLARRRRPALRADAARPRGHGAALRSGHLRGPQGVPAAGRHRRLLPGRRERRASARLGAADGHAGAARRPVPQLDHRAARGGQGLGPGGGRRGVAVPAAVHDRDRGGPRGAAGQPVPLPADRLAGRCLLPAGRQAGQRVAVHRVRAGGPGRHRSGEVRRATTRPRWSPRRRPPTRVATRWSGSTRSSAATSRRWAG